MYIEPLFFEVPRPNNPCIPGTCESGAKQKTTMQLILKVGAAAAVFVVLCTLAICMYIYPLQQRLIDYESNVKVFNSEELDIGHIAGMACMSLSVCDANESSKIGMQRLPIHINRTAFDLTPVADVSRVTCALAMVDAARLAGKRSVYRLHQRVMNTSIIDTNSRNRRLKVPTENACQEQCRHDAGWGENLRAEQLMTPPLKIQKWNPLLSVDDTMKALSKKYLARYLKNGIRSHDVELLPGQYTDAVRFVCEEPMRLKLAGGEVYLESPSDELKAFYKKDFLASRRFFAAESIRKVLHDPTWRTRLSELRTTLLVCTGDGDFKSDKFDRVKLAPVLSVSQSTGTLPFPDMNSGNRGVGVEEVFQWRTNYTWCSRLNHAVFRGGGRTCCPGPWIGGGEMSEPLDALKGPNPATGGESCMRQEMMRQAGSCASKLVNIGVDGPNLPMHEQERYKMIVYAGGHFGWADRLKHLLAMGNAVIMQHNNCGVEWYSHHLKPWVHYIPMDHLYRNLGPMVAWAIANDCMVQQISRNADTYARHFLSVASTHSFIAQLLIMYANLTRFDTTLTSDDILLDDSMNVTLFKP